MKDRWIMFGVNDVVSYSSAGVCEITEITQREIAGTRMDYYVLKPRMDLKSTVFVPVKNPKLISRMRPVLSSAEADQLLGSLRTLSPKWIENDNQRKEVFRSLITDGLPQDLALIYKTLTVRRKELEENSRKLRSADEGFLKECEKLLSFEISYAQGCSSSEAKALIISLCS